MPTPPADDRTYRRRLAIGDRIRQARHWANLTQEQLGERAGISEKTISRYENGTQAPTLDRLLDLADGLGVPPAALLPGWPTDGWEWPPPSGDAGAGAG